jgi:cytochrome c-type biogenesis protein CcmH/NrfF
MRLKIWIGITLGLILGLTAVRAQDATDPRVESVLGSPNGSPIAGEELAEATEELTRRMRCPVCQGLSVAASSSPSALAMSAKAEALLAQGYDGEQVLNYFESSYGEFIRLEPRAEGYNLLVWILPALVLVVGLALVWLRLRRGSGVSALVEEDAELEAYRARVRQEVGL